MTHPSINWKSIREHHGSQESAFEELCCQLAGAEQPAGSAFIRKGTPDAGVECYAILDGGDEWAWQAKYFTSSPGGTQWKQIDKSVKAALDGHRRLVRYLLCLPVDLPDARMAKQRSAKEQWDLHEEKWKSWATERSMDVAFELWGSHELTDRLMRPEHAGRVAYWFDTSALTPKWFSDRIDEAIKEAGARYTPEVHVELPIAKTFAGMGRTPEFFDHLKSKARLIRKEFRHLRFSGSPSDSTCVLGVDEKAEGLIDAGALGELVRLLLTWFADLAHQPVGKIPFSDALDMLDKALRVIGELTPLVRAKSEERAAEDGMGRGRTGTRLDAFDYALSGLYRLRTTLEGVHHDLSEAAQLTDSPVVVLSGRAGTGKSHLLCDIASKRLDAGQPTVLLMGQRFIGVADPWRQCLAQLDLFGLDADQFVGALEACAQASKARALFIIDALNEGAGRKLWPENLASFVQRLARSEWITVVLSVRTPLEEVILPDEVRNTAHDVPHHGFQGVEYDATRTFFDHYGLERPSAPSLVPEFSNPLFLKVLCEGLSESGAKKLPRGFHGIKAVFDLYLTAVNARIALLLEYPKSRSYVHDAVSAFVRAFPDPETPWVNVDAAETAVAEAVPSFGVENRLYMALSDAGVLVETLARNEGGKPEVLARLAYDRLGNHLVISALLDGRSRDELSGLFADGPLGFVSEKDPYAPSGLVESLCTQIPELWGVELVDLVPEVAEKWCYADAFRQSVVWRAPKSVLNTTWTRLVDTIEYEADERAVLELLLQVATVPAHPLNADFLDGFLSPKEMAERDGFWSTYLHLTWEGGGAVDRLVEWAWHSSADHEWDTDSVRLAAIALGWMLSTPNRYLRDSATKALVSILTPKPELLEDFLRRFGQVNDPYIAERSFAVVLGCALRNEEPRHISDAARCAYELVFAPEATPLHFLLRDYARGIVEWALHIGVELEIDGERIRPPYRSEWPKMPDEEDIEQYRPDRSKGSYDSGDEGWWSQNRVWSSVFNDDFGHYIIESRYRDWLKVGLGEPRWISPDQRLEQLTAGASEDVKALLERYGTLSRDYRLRALAELLADGSTENETSLDPDFCEVEEGLLALLPKDGPEVSELLRQRRDGASRSPPSFEADIIKRYVVQRVFELGWTRERFGDFDRFNIGYAGRSAKKPERMGKKYQWIALHEMGALLTDHFQYTNEWAGDDGYEGPWQGYWRDIDPTCLLASRAGGTGFGPHEPSWWAAPLYDAWPIDQSYNEWTAVTEDLPDLQPLLSNSDSEGTSWLALQGHYSWNQPTPADQERHEEERGEIWYQAHSYLVRSADADAFEEWGQNQDFWGRWMPDPPTHTGLYLGEIGWSPAALYFERPYFGQPGWTRPRECPVDVLGISEEYAGEISGYDCSMDESVHLHIPSRTLIGELDLAWSGVGADFLDRSGSLAVFDPTSHGHGPDALLIREDALRRLLGAGAYTLFWVVLGEKRTLGGDQSDKDWSSLRVSGVLALREGGPAGSVTATFLDGSRDEEGELIGRQQVITV